MIYFINTFIVCYLFIAWSWSLPKNSARRRVAQKLGPIVRWLGLWHSWSMFAPEPILVERKLAVELAYKDQSVDVYDLPDIADDPAATAFLNIRDRKYQSVLCKKNEAVQRPALCRYFADHYTDPNRSLLKCQLVVHRRWIRDPTAAESSDQNDFERILLWTIDFSTP